MEPPESFFTYWTRWQEKASEIWGRHSGSLPSMPSMPSIPGFGSLPSMPSMSSIPGFGSLPSMPSMSSIPGFGSLPKVRLPWVSDRDDGPFGGKDMVKEWTELSEGLFRNYVSFAQPGVGPEAMTKGVDAMKVYWSLYEYWTRLVEGMSAFKGGEASADERRKLEQKLRDDYEPVMRSVLGAPPEALGEVMAWQGRAWGRFMALLDQVQAPFKSMQGQWAGLGAKLSSGDPANVRESFSVMQKTFLDTVGGLINLPAFGMSREHEERLRSTMDAYMQFEAILPVYYSTFQGASREAYEKLMAESKTLASDTSPEGFKKFYRAWVTINEDTFYELFKRGEFADLMNKVLDRGLNLRMKLNDLASRSLKAWNVPTREEMTDVYRTLYEQRKQIKALRRRLDALEGEDRD